MNIVSLFLILFIFLTSQAQMLCFKDLNGNGNFEIGTNEVSNCQLSSDGTSYLCPTGKEQCVLKGQCPSTCCWSGDTPVFNPNTGLCETNPGWRSTYPGKWIKDPINSFTTDFSGYDSNRKCFVDSSNNCLTSTAEINVSANAGDQLRPWGEINRASSVNTRAGVKMYVNGVYHDGTTISGDPYTWGNYTMSYTANTSGTYTFKFEYYGYTPEPDTKIAVRVALFWKNSDGDTMYIGWPSTGYDNTNETNPKVYEYSLYLDPGETFYGRFERHSAMYQSNVNATVKIAQALIYPDGSVSYLGVKSCNVTWLTGWWNNCGGWGSITATQTGTYTLQTMVYANSSNPSVWGDNAYLMLIKAYSSCHWQYPYNSSTGKCEGIPTKIDWTCPSGNYQCIPMDENGTIVNYCNTTSCTDKYGSTCY